MQDPFYEYGGTQRLPDAPQGIELFASGARAEMPFAEPEESVGGGFSVRQIGGTISPAATVPTTAEYQSALVSAYTAAAVDPKTGDYVTLRKTGAGDTDLVARFWIFDDDDAKANATVSFVVDTVTYYAINATYSPIEQLTSALSSADSGEDPDGRDVEPDGTADFSISVNDVYDTDANGFLVVPAGAPKITIKGGTIDVTDDISATATAVSNVTTYNFPGSDGITYVHIYLEVSVTLGRAGGTPSAATATIKHRTTTTAGVPAVSEISYPSGKAERSFTIGVVALARKGNRRYARITQTLAGDIEQYATGTGSNTLDSNGVNKAAGPREITLVINGQYIYTTTILTGELTEVT